MKPTLLMTLMTGVLAYFNAPVQHDPRQALGAGAGVNVGRQIIGLYIVEVLLKHALANAGEKQRYTHDLHDLFMKLTSQQRCAVEKKYTELLNTAKDTAWDVAETVDSLLRYLGKNAITDTRYILEPGLHHAVEGASITVDPEMLRPLIYALFNVLHEYPLETMEKRYDTTFEPLTEFIKQDMKRAKSELPADPPIARSLNPKQPPP